jgi:hypothetical protein
MIFAPLVCFETEAALKRSRVKDCILWWRCKGRLHARKDHLTKQKESREALGFTADEIVRAIEAVQQAGLTVYGVEITLTGSISISTTPPSNRAAASKPEASASALKDTEPNKKRA